LKEKKLYFWEQETFFTKLVCRKSGFVGKPDFWGVGWGVPSSTGGAGEFLNQAQYAVPVWGACKQFGDCMSNGDYVGAIANFALGFAEAFTLGYGTGYRLSLNAAKTTANVAAKTGVQYSDDLVKAAQKLYPNKAGTTQLHHIAPKYLGGAADGALVPLDGAYHQVMLDIMKQVYTKFPLPPGY